MSEALDSGQFLALILRFVGGSMTARDFCAQFVPLWTGQRDATYAIKKTWSRPLDQDLLAAWRRGELTEDAFHAEWVKLWGYDPVFQRLVDTIHSACAVYRPDPELAWEIDEEQLRRDVELALSEYRGSGGTEP